MENSELTGIERELVLQYLIDGNVPVTVTLVESQELEDGAQLPVIFPVALKAEQIEVSHKGVILLKNPPEDVQKFAGKQVKVEFYFHRMGLYFITQMQETSSGLAIDIPDAIQRIQSQEVRSKYDLTVNFYFSCRNQSNINIDCVPEDGYTLFSRPVWSSIPVEKQVLAKGYLEKFVAEAKKEKNAGNGIQLISICRYLVEDVAATPLPSLQSNVKSLGVLYVDHERFVLASAKGNFPLAIGGEYAVKMSLRLKDGPILSRNIFVTCVVAKIFKIENDERVVAECLFTSIQEEDVRFLYEKATSKLFI